MPGWLFFILIIFLISIVVVVSVVSIKISAKKNCVSWVEKLWKKDSTKAISSSLLSIFFGLIIGCIILFLMILFPTEDVQINLNQALNGIQLIFFGMFNTGRTATGQLAFGFNGTSIGNMLFRATPLILTGLSVAVAFKTGLFNIGAPGQYLVGTTATLILALAILTAVLSLTVFFSASFNLASREDTSSLYIFFYQAIPCCKQWNCKKHTTNT